MTDEVEIKGLRVLGHHGALEGEQDRAQPFELDIAFSYDMDEAARSDDLVDAIDYGEVTSASLASSLSSASHCLRR